MKKHYRFVLLAVFLSVWVIVLLYISPAEIVEVIGVEWGYALIFATGLIGISSFTSASFYATVAALASTGEFNPFLIGLVASPAMAFGDSVFFFLGRHGRAVVHGERLERMTRWMRKRPAWTVPALSYVYTGFTPLPQDLLMTSLGLIEAKFRYVLPAILFGNATFITIVSYFVMHGYSLVEVL